jgi:hypothetical protein
MDNFGDVVANAYNFGQDGDDKGFCQCIMTYKAIATIDQRWEIDHTVPAIPPAKSGMTLRTYYKAVAKKDSKCTIYQWSDNTDVDFVPYADGGGRLTVTMFKYARCVGCKKTKDSDGKPNCEGGASLCHDKLDMGNFGLNNPAAKKLMDKMLKNKNKKSTVKRVMRNLVRLFKLCEPLLLCKGNKCPD